MLTSLMVAGFGGQGVMLIGKLVSQCVFEEGLQVTFLPSYGPEQRGGTANCTVIISDEEIGSPVSEELDVLCAMNQPSLDKYARNVRDNGVIITNSTLVNVDKIKDLNVKILEVDADALAYELGSNKVSNIIILAAYITASKVISVEVAKKIILKQLGRKKEFLELNQKAFEAGVNVAEEAMKKWEMAYGK